MIRGLMMLCLFSASSAAFAQFSELTPLVGYQQGGGYDSGMFGLMGSFDRARGRKLDLIVSHQKKV
ncbi:MAG TPA: hypothetical protein VGK04_01720, partial [Thermoanaerobaculia bacterium]